MGTTTTWCMRADFVLSVRKVFVDVGLAPNPNGRYVVYTHHTKPSVALKLHGPSKPPDKHTSALDLLVKEVEVEPCDFCDETACRALFDEMDAGAAWEDSSDGEGAMEAEAEGKSGGDGEAKGKSGDGDGGDSVGGTTAWAETCFQLRQWWVAVAAAAAAATAVRSLPLLACLLRNWPTGRPCTRSCDIASLSHARVI